MSKQNEKATLISELGPYALMPNSRIACASALYLSYCDYKGKKNAELTKIANNSVSRDTNSKTLQTLIQSKTKTFKQTQFEANAVDLSVRNFLDYRLSNSNIYLSELLLNILDVQNSDVVYDFGSGTGAFLTCVARKNKDSLVRPDIRGIEINSDDVAVSKLLLEICGAKYTIKNEDFLTYKFDEKADLYDKGYVFPPFGLKYSEVDTHTSEIYKELINSRTSSEWLFVLKALMGLKENGRLVALLPDGALFKAPDAAIRKYLLNQKLIEGIISLPSNAFDDSNIKFSLVVLSKGNDSFKYVDGEELLKDLPIKGLRSSEASRYLYVEYFRKDVKKYSLKNVETVHFNLSKNSIINNDYELDGTLPTLGQKADILRGCNLTFANFKDDIYEGESAYQILTSSDIKEDGSVDLDSLIHIGGDKKYEKFTVQKGDVVMTSKSTKVKVAVINEEPKHKVVVTGGMIIIRPHKDELSGAYLKMYLDSEKGKKTLSLIQKGTVTVTISFENLGMIKINVPDIKTQKEFESEFENLANKRKEARKKLEDAEKEIANFVNKIVA